MRTTVIDAKAFADSCARAARRFEDERGHERTCTTVLDPKHPFEGCNCVVADIERGCMGDVVHALLAATAAPSPATLPLTRPLVCLDVESTGTSPETDRIVELGLVVLRPDGTRTPLRWLLNPGGPIPPASTAVHHITDEQVAGAPGFVDVAEEVAAALTDVDLCGYNLRAFDLPILRAEFARAGVAWPCEGARVVDAFIIFRERERHTLETAVRHYLGRAHTGAHAVVDDAQATLDVLLAQLLRYPDLPRDLAALDQASGGRQPDWATERGHLRWDAEGEAVIAFGKNAGTRLRSVDVGFLRWVLRNDFPADVKALCEASLAGEDTRAPWAPAPPAPAPSPAFGAIEGDDIPF